MSPKEIPDELIYQLLAGREGLESITGPDGLLKQLTKRVVERAASAELTDHLGYEPLGKPPEGESNRRNGWSSKTLITDHGPVEVDLPRDREGSFEPQIVPKHQRRLAGFDDKIISMYARGMSTREISKHLEEIYGVEVGRDTISRITDAVLDDGKEWQAGPREEPSIDIPARRSAFASIAKSMRDGHQPVRAAERPSATHERSTAVKNARNAPTAAAQQRKERGLRLRLRRLLQLRSQRRDRSPPLQHRSSRQDCRAPCESGVRLDLPTIPIPATRRSTFRRREKLRGSGIDLTVRIRGFVCPFRSPKNTERLTAQS
jgi:hypothetical protein